MRITALLCFCAILAIAWPACAQPATQPSATQPTDAQSIGRWLDDLAHADEAVREAARVQLMGLTRPQLALLRNAIVEANGLGPSQKAVLPDIVQHAWLASEPFDRGLSGFLGVVLNRDDELDDDGRSPVVIESRLQGFCSYQLLQDGDIILEMEERPEPKLRDKTDLIEGVSAFRPGDTIHLKVQRAGRELRIALRLDARPAAAQGVGAAGMIEEFKNLRGAAAEKYWKQQFAPLLDATTAKRNGAGQVTSPR